MQPVSWSLQSLLLMLLLLALTAHASSRLVAAASQLFVCSPVPPSLPPSLSHLLSLLSHDCDLHPYPMPTSTSVSSSHLHGTGTSPLLSETGAHEVIQLALHKASDTRGENLQTRSPASTHPLL